jgi:hypothetical protein
MTRVRLAPTAGTGRANAGPHRTEPARRPPAPAGPTRTSSATGVRQERFHLDPEVDGGRSKVENGRTARAEGFLGTLLGGGIGAGVGALLGGIVGGSTGAAVGGGVGALVGGIVGALVGGIAISWNPATYAASPAAGSSTTTERPFTVTYTARRDESGGVWRLGVSRIEGGVDILVRTGGSRDPGAAPPGTEAEARDAVTVMKGYYARGSRGSWHTEAASRAHEEHHEREWKGAAEHYWPPTLAVLTAMTVPLAGHGSEAAAVAAMRGGPAGADARIAAFTRKAHDYWFTLADNAASRPYAAGQRVLNSAVRAVQGLAAGNGWVVPQGTDSPNTEPPCYQPWLPYVP